MNPQHGGPLQPIQVGSVRGYRHEALAEGLWREHHGALHAALAAKHAAAPHPHGNGQVEVTPKPVVLRIGPPGAARCLHKDDQLVGLVVVGRRAGRRGPSRAAVLAVVQDALHERAQ